MCNPRDPLSSMANVFQEQMDKINNMRNTRKDIAGALKYTDTQIIVELNRIVDVMAKRSIDNPYSTDVNESRITLTSGYMGKRDNFITNIELICGYLQSITTEYMAMVILDERIKRTTEIMEQYASKNRTFKGLDVLVAKGTLKRRRTTSSERVRVDQPVDGSDDQPVDGSDDQPVDVQRSSERVEVGDQTVNQYLGNIISSRTNKPPSLIDTSVDELELELSRKPSN